jgi:hypothetical protein
MRRTLTVCHHGLSAAAVVVMLTACGGSENGDSAASESTPSAAESSAAPESSADAAGSEFCTEAPAIEGRIDSTIQNSQDPQALPQALQEAANEIRAIEPPDEIASDWNALADGAEQIAAAIAQVDFRDPNALATFQQQVGQLESQLSSASTNVETYLREECGIDTGSGESAAPTS